jgi:hypothetical protein
MDDKKLDYILEGTISLSLSLSLSIYIYINRLSKQKNDGLIGHDPLLSHH